MTTQTADAPMTVDAFLRWSETADRTETFELDAGRPLAMAPERVRHGKVKGAAFAALREAARGLDCTVLVDSVLVPIDAETGYVPDVLVQCGEAIADDGAVARAPMIVVEVTSPSTAMRDAVVKLQGYFTLPSLRHYLIVDPVGRRVVHYERGADGAIGTHIVAPAALGERRLDPPGLSVDLRRFFEDLDGDGAPGGR